MGGEQVSADANANLLLTNEKTGPLIRAHLLCRDDVMIGRRRRHTHTHTQGYCPGSRLQEAGCSCVSMPTAGLWTILKAGLAVG